MTIILPDLQRVKNELELKGAKYPLAVVKMPVSGLLEKLPSAPAGKTGWPWTTETDPALYSRARNWPKLTIVTPSYNQGQFIEQTIRAVLLQNYPNLEYIIMDGGSTDNTLDVIKRYGSWISYWQSGQDRGQAHAINMGFSLASGKYLAWINSDDYYLKDVFYQVAVNFVSSKANFIYGYAINFDTATQTSRLIRTFPLLDYFIRIPTLAQPSCFWAASIHQPLWEQLQCSLDYELWIRMVKGKKRKLIRAPLSVANIHAEAKSSNEAMNMAWRHDHELICGNDAHGPVKNWDKLIKLKSLFEVFINIWDRLSFNKKQVN